MLCYPTSGTHDVMGSYPRAQTLSQPHSSSSGRELIRDIKSWERAYHTHHERKRLVCRDEQNLY